MSKKSQKRDKIGAKIADATSKQIVMWDERCTTVMAHNALNMTDTRGKKRKNVIDTLSAEIILQNLLDRLKN